MFLTARGGWREREEKVMDQKIGKDFAENQRQQAERGNRSSESGAIGIPTTAAECLCILRADSDENGDHDVQADREEDDDDRGASPMVLMMRENGSSGWYLVTIVSSNS